MRNLYTDPKVPLKIGRQWRSGTAVVLPDDDPAARSRTLPAPVARRDRTDHCLPAATNHIDLDPD